MPLIPGSWISEFEAGLVFQMEFQNSQGSIETLS